MFLIVDGSSLLVTAYYGNLPRSILFEKDENKKKQYYSQILHSSDGRYTNAVYTMTKQLLKILQKQKPEHIAIVFDKTRNTFRRELYSDYKGNRGETPEPLKEQFQTMEDLLEKAGFPVFYGDTFEADDYAGSLVERFQDETSIRLLSKDHDYLQLISEQAGHRDVRCWILLSAQDKADELMKQYYGPDFTAEELKRIRSSIPDKTVEYTDDFCYQQEGVYSWQIVDKKGMSGDSADNIPGIKGVSDKTAVPLLQKYGSLEELYKAMDAMEDEKQEKELAAGWKTELGISRNPIKLLKEGRELAFLSKELATIRRDVEVPTQLENYRLQINKEAWKQELQALECVSLLAEIDGL